MKRKKYEYGTYVENPASKITESQILNIRADQKAKSDGLVQGLQLIGSLAQQTGTAVMNQGISSGEGQNGGLEGFFANNGNSILSALNAYGLSSNIHAMGGTVKIKPSNKGKFTAAAKKAGMGVQEYASKILANKDKYSSTLVKRANFAKNASKWKHAYGGNVPVNVENEEVGELPSGDILEFNGNTHEQGGIDIALPGGTEIYSERVKVDGKSMADRKLTRERKELKSTKNLGKDPTNIFAQNSLNRTTEVNEQEDQFDTMIQNLIKTTADRVKYATGGKIPPYLIDEEYTEPDTANVIRNLGIIGAKQNIVDDVTVPYRREEATNKIPAYLDPNTQPATYQQPDYNVYKRTIPNFEQQTNNNVQVPYRYEDELGDTVTTPKSKFSMDNILGTVTGGDIFGLTGDIISTFGPYKNTLLNRAGDTPNINPYTEYGKEGLKTIDKTKGYVAQQMDAALKKIASSRATGIKRNANTARGINTLRGLNLTQDVIAGNAEADIRDAYTKQMMNILQMEAQMKDKRDAVVMEGEGRRDMLDRSDRDKYFTNRAKDIATIGYGLQQTGKDINTMKERDVMQNLINELSKYGITVDSSGKLSSKKKK